jgi:LPXTG-site transpeptidase (sortase) family protein
VRAAVGNLLMAAGIALLLATGGLYLYGAHEERQAAERAADLDRFDRATATARAVGELVATAQARGAATATASAAARLPTATPRPPNAPSAAATAAPTVVASPTPAPTATPAVTEIRRVIAPSIRLDAPVVFSELRGGEWDVPKFVAGHLQGTALPGTGGNVVLSGHNQSLTSGNVFADIEKLRVGDEVVLRTNVGEATYRIAGRNVVENDDVSVVRAGPTEEVTLITCTGTFNVLEQDYSHRVVVWGTRVD